MKYTDWSAECPEFLHVHRLHLEFPTDNYSGSKQSSFETFPKKGKHLFQTTNRIIFKRHTCACIDIFSYHEAYMYQALRFFRPSTSICCKSLDSHLWVPSSCLPLLTWTTLLLVNSKSTWSFTFPSGLGYSAPILVSRTYHLSGLRQESRALGATILKWQRK